MTLARLSAACLSAAGLSAALLSLGAAAAFAADPPLEKVTVHAVAQFDFGRASLRPADQATMLAEVGQMKDVTWQSVRAVGHTDSIGKPAYNQQLAARRAQSVRDYLTAKGLDPAMISTDAKAAAVPVADNDSPAGRARNRRAEIEFSGVRAAVRP